MKVQKPGVVCSLFALTSKATLVYAPGVSTTSLQLLSCCVLTLTIIDHNNKENDIAHLRRILAKHT